LIAFLDFFFHCILPNLQKIYPMKTKLFSWLFAFVLCGSCAQNDTSIQTPTNINYNLELIVPELDIPWGLAMLPDKTLLITEKSGSIIHFKEGTKHEVSKVPETYLRGQGGLMGIAIHPDFASNKRVYFTQSSSVDSDEEGGNTALFSAILSDDELTDVKLLHKAQPNTRVGRHFGSRIVFDNEGYLYFSVGDRGRRDDNPQNLTRDGGKVYRLHDDGTIPSDNPFVKTDGAVKAVFSYGHRNPQGMVLHPETGAIWTHEHGPLGGDEINIIRAGANYGWPKITYGKNYSGTTITKDTALPGMEQPLYYWIPSIAPSGMAFVSGEVYPEWEGSLLVGSLKFKYLERLIIEDNKVVYREKVAEDIGRVRDVIMGVDGYIYIAIENKGIYKIVPKT